MTRRGLFQAIAALAAGNAIPVGPVVPQRTDPVTTGTTTGTDWSGAHTHTIAISPNHVHCCGQGTQWHLTHTHPHGHGT